MNTVAFKQAKQEVFFFEVWYIYDQGYVLMPAIAQEQIQ